MCRADSANFIICFQQTNQTQKTKLSTQNYSERSLSNVHSLTTQNDYSQCSVHFQRFSYVYRADSTNFISYFQQTNQTPKQSVSIENML